jgi:hypothetical protein
MSQPPNVSYVHVPVADGECLVIPSSHLNQLDAFAAWSGAFFGTQANPFQNRGWREIAMQHVEQKGALKNLSVLADLLADFPELIVLEEISRALVRFAHAGSSEPFKEIAKAIRKHHGRRRTRQDEAWTEIEGLRAATAEAEAFGLPVEKWRSMSARERLEFADRRCYFAMKVAQHRMARLFPDVSARGVIRLSSAAQESGRSVDEGDGPAAALYKAYDREKKRRRVTSRRRLEFLDEPKSIRCAVHEGRMDRVFQDPEQ